VSGRESAFEVLIRPHLKPLYRVAYRLTGRREDAEDLVQELLVKLYGRRREVEAIDRLRPWLLRVLYCQFIDNHRRHSRSPLHLVADQGGAVDPLDSLAAPEPDPEAMTAQAAETRALLAAIARLSEDHRIVIGLHDVEGYTLEEIQPMLDCPIGTLKSRLHRARARLRELLGEPPAADKAAEEPAAGRRRGVARNS
jgi:RNA polymerase sigma-70 factor (ECF subfamily)